MSLVSTISVQLQRNPQFRRIAERYGRAYWSLPSILRKHLVWEEDIPHLPQTICHIVGEREVVGRIQHSVLKYPPTPSHRMAAQGFENPPAWVTCIKDAWLVGSYASPVTMQGNLLMTAFCDAPRIFGLEPRDDIEHWLSERRWLAEAPVVYENVCPMTNRLESNYFHWLIEWCGRLEWLERYREKTGQPVKLLLPETGPDYIKESLTLLGWGPDTWIHWSPTTRAARVKNLLIPSFRGTAVSTSPSALQWLRKRLLHGAGIGQPACNLKIYIPRRPGAWRSVNNSEEVESFLHRIGFTILEPHLLKLREQVSFFAQARVIVGLHGAGLANVLMAPAATLIELLGTYGNATYFGMTARLNQDYASMVCTPIEDNVHVDIQQLARVTSL